MEELRVVAQVRRREEGAVHHLMPTLAKDTRLLWVGEEISDADGTLLSAPHHVACNAILELKQDATGIVANLHSIVGKQLLAEDYSLQGRGSCVACKDESVIRSSISLLFGIVGILGIVGTPTMWHAHLSRGARTWCSNNLSVKVS
jgi:hypothetical protein